MSVPNGVFVNYRRSDTQYAAARLADALERSFGRGQIFRDLQGIPVGHEFAAVLRDVLSDCHTMLVVIGDHWLDAHDERGQRRLDDHEDWVRQEIEAALARNIRVVPVLIDLATLPTESVLPPTIRRLVHRHAVRLTDANWDQDVATLIERLPAELLSGRDVRSLGPPLALSGRAIRRISFWLRKPIVIVGGLIALWFYSSLSTCTALSTPDLAGPWKARNGWKLSFLQSQVGGRESQRYYQVVGEDASMTQINCDAEQSYSLVKLSCRARSTAGAEERFFCERLHFAEVAGWMEGECLWFSDNSTRKLSLMRPSVPETP